VIETPRLRLRRPRPDDVDAVHAYRSRPDVARHLSGGTWTREHTVSELALYAAADFSGPGDELVLLVEVLVATAPSTDGRGVEECTYAVCAPPA
jgi:RimJ/RimL family protein N-acetyltransferase